MGKLGFYFDSDACIGCHTCAVACKDRHNLDVGVNYRKVYTYETGEYPNPSMYHLTMSCNHCENPTCVGACPTGATFVAEDGTVQYDKSLCIFCKSCVAACPYGAPVPIEASLLIGKCDSCKPLRDAGMNPCCVDACPQRVLEFGDLDELKAKHEGEKLVDKLAPMPAADTKPSILIHAKECAFDEDYERITI